MKTTQHRGPRTTDMTFDNKQIAFTCFRKTPTMGVSSCVGSQRLYINQRIDKVSVVLVGESISQKNIL